MRSHSDVLHLAPAKLRAISSDSLQLGMALASKMPVSGPGSPLSSNAANYLKKIGEELAVLTEEADKILANQSNFAVEPNPPRPK